MKDAYISIEELAKKLVVVGVKLGPYRVVELFMGWVEGAYLRAREYAVLEWCEDRKPLFS